MGSALASHYQAPANSRQHESQYIFITAAVSGKYKLCGH